MVMFMCSGAFAQKTITGTVTDNDTKEPLIGATVLVTGTSAGTVTDLDGKYSLTIPDGAESISISYTGFSTQSITIGTSTVIDAALSPGELLDEVVVTGYGTSKSREVTGSTAGLGESGALLDDVDLKLVAELHA